MNESDGAPACPACDGRAFDPFRFGLVRCRSCGLVHDPVAVRRSHAESVQEEWFGTPTAARSRWVRTFESWNNGRTLARVRRFVQSPARVLEVGIGSGSLLATMRSAGFDAEGCEISPRVAEYVRKAVGVPVFNGPLETFEPPAQFDVVVLNHVVEHTSYPVQFLEAARRLARPGALFHIAVPNVACWEAQLSGWTSYEPYHLLYFSPLTLNAVAERAGLRSLEATTFETFSGWFLAGLRTALGRRLRHAERREEVQAARESSGLEHLYRTAMLATGAALYPLRGIQARVGAGEEAILLATHDG